MENIFLGNYFPIFQSSAKQQEGNDFLTSAREIQLPFDRDGSLCPSTHMIRFIYRSRSMAGWWVMLTFLTRKPL